LNTQQAQQRVNILYRRLKKYWYVILLLPYLFLFAGCVYTVSMTHGGELENNEIAQLGEGEETIHIVSVDTVKINVHEFRQISIRLLPGTHHITVNLGSTSYNPSAHEAATFASDDCPTLTYHFEAGHQYRIYPHLSWGSWKPYIKDETD